MITFPKVCRSAVLVLGLSAPLVGFTESASLVFRGTVDRTIAPQGEKLTPAIATGTAVSGKIELVTSHASRDTERPSGKDTTIWFNAVKELVFDVGVSAKFSGGNLWVQNGLMQLSATPNYCIDCSGDGKPIETASSNGSAAKIYFPTHYLMVQSAGHEGTQAVFEELIRDVLAFSQSVNSKIMIFYSEKGFKNGSPKIIINVDEIESQ